MKLKAGDIVEYQFESMSDIRLARVMDVAQYGVYVLDRRLVVYVPYAFSYLKRRTDVPKELYVDGLEAAKQKLLDLQRKITSKLAAMGDPGLLD